MQNYQQKSSHEKSTFQVTVWNNIDAGDNKTDLVEIAFTLTFF